MALELDPCALEVLMTVKRIVSLLQRENAALKVDKLQEVKDLQEEKQKLLQALGSLNETMESVDDLKDKVSKKLMEELTEQNKILYKNLCINETLIRIKLEVNTEILKNVQRQLNSQCKNQAGYDNKGSLLSKAKLAQIMPPIVLSNKI